MTKEVQIGRLKLGNGNPVLVQSMTNTDTRDAEATLKQIRALAEAGCDLVRVSVYDEACADAGKTLTDRSPVPLVADLHFDHRKSANLRIARKRIISRSGSASTAVPSRRTCWQSTGGRRRNAWWKARWGMRGCWKRPGLRISC